MQPKKDRIRPFEPALYALLGALLGAAVGAVIVLFGRGVEFCAGYGAAHFSLYVWFLPVVGLLTAAMLLPFLSGGGPFCDGFSGWTGL